MVGVAGQLRSRETMSRHAYRHPRQRGFLEFRVFTERTQIEAFSGIGEEGRPALMATEARNTGIDGHYDDAVGEGNFADLGGPELRRSIPHFQAPLSHAALGGLKAIRAN